MDKKSNIVEFKNEDFYFLYIEKLSEKGMTNRSWHMHSFYEIMFFAEGNSEYVIENNRYVIEKGDVLLIRPGEHHFERRVIEPAFAVYCLGFDSDAIKNGTLVKKIFDSHEHISLGTSHPIAEILSATKNILKLSKSNAPTLIKSIAEAAVIALDDPKLTYKSETKKIDTPIEKILDFINKNLFEIKSIDDITNGVFFSNSYIRATFKREMGIGVMQYVRNKKILAAHRRIRRGERPTAVYAECGFANYPSFYRAYCAYCGHSPKRISKA